ncbi:MAG: TonB-dependent siderophore receptor [Paracraurococcus sp.]
MPLPSRALGGALLAAAAGLSTPALSQPASEVPPVVVYGQRPEDRDQVGPVRGYQALTSSSATRTDTPLREIPQSVTVLPRKLLDEQGARTLEDALRNAPGVVPESPLFLNQNLNTLVRGFQAEIYRDGLQSYLELGLAQSLLGVERVEVIKGPSGSLFGGGLGGGLGGVVNIISRQPAAANSYETGVRLGPYGYRNFFFDVNQVAATVDGTQYIVRLQGEQLHSRSYISDVTTDGFNIQPALTIRNDRTNLTIQGFFSERRANDYPGLPPELMQGTRFGFDRFVNANGANVPRTVTNRNGVRASFEHKIDEVFTLRFASQYTSNRLSQPAQFQFGSAQSYGLPANDTTYVRYNAFLGQELTQFTVLPTLQARFATGPVRHTALAGVEFDQTTDNGRMDIGDYSLFDFAAPANTPFVLPSGPSPLSIPQTRNTYRTVAGFVQDQVTAWDRVHLLAAVRLTNLDISTQPEGSARSSVDTTRATPRLGLAVDVVPGVTPFIGWGTGIRSPGGYSFNGFLQRPRPEESEQLEAGVKVELPFGITGNVAYFDIDRRNVAYFDLAAGGNRQIGEQRSRGVDLDLLWQPDRNMSVLGSFAHTVAETVQDSIIAKGSPLRLVPRNAARGWAAYRFAGAGAGPEWLDGLVIGAGFTAVAGAPTSDSAAPVWTKGYTTFDAQIGYDVGPLRLALTGRNLGDRRYVIPFSYFNNAVAPGAPREVYLTASLRF